MKAKKLTAVLVAAAMTATVLAGCGGNDTKKDAAADNNETSAAGESGGSGSADLDQVTLTLTTTFSETESAGQMVAHFKDYVEEQSDGAVTVDVSYGGTLASDTEELSFVSSGAVDMTVLNQNNYTDVFPLLNFPSQVYSDEGFEASIAIFDYMMSENEETAGLIEAQTEAQNIHMLGGVPAGTNCFVSKKQCTTLDELTKLKLGAGINLSAFNEMGFNVVSVMPNEYYDSLSRGIIDTGYFPISVFVSMSLQEVTPYFILDGSYTAGNFFSMNLDKWNSLSKSTQNFLEEAMDETQQYAIKLANEQTNDAKTTIEEAGGAVTELSDADKETVKSVLFNTAVSDARSYAKTYGCTEEMETVLKAVSEYQGIELPEN